MGHRTLKLTHEEVERIVTALDQSWQNKLIYIQKGRNLIDDATKESIRKNADRYGDLATDISGGIKDV
ncbi:MAG: hypothetical protein ABFS35_21145 [Bacteroidota bacterium]